MTKLKFLLFLSVLAATQVVAQTKRANIDSEIQLLEATIIAQDRLLHEGFIYIGKISRNTMRQFPSSLSAELCDNLPYTATDYRAIQQIQIPLPKSRVRLFPSRPKSSYKMDSVGVNTSVLKITDQKLFWEERSKYLVVRTGVDTLNQCVNLYKDSQCKKVSYNTIRSRIASTKKQFKTKKLIREQLFTLVEEQDDLSNRAYVLIATEQKLKEWGVLNTRFFSKDRLYDGPWPREHFIQVDCRMTNAIDIHGISPKIYTTHPSDSYMIEAEDTNRSKLMILDPKRFWRYSRYLVIRVE